MLNVSIPQPSDFLLKPKPFIKMNTPQDNARGCLCRYVATESHLSHMRALAPRRRVKELSDPGTKPSPGRFAGEGEIEDFLRGYRFFYPQSFPANIDDLLGGIRTKRAVGEDKWRIIIVHSLRH